MPDSKINFYIKIAAVFITGAVGIFAVSLISRGLPQIPFILAVCYVPCAAAYLVYHAIQAAHEIIQRGR